MIPTQNLDMRKTSPTNRGVPEKRLNVRGLSYASGHFHSISESPTRNRFSAYLIVLYTYCLPVDAPSVLSALLSISRGTCAGSIILGLSQWW